MKAISLSQELSELFHARSEQLMEICRISGVTMRVDALTLLTRELLRSSSLCYIGGDICFYDGHRYVKCSFCDVMSCVGNILIDMGVPPTDVRRMGDMAMPVIRERSYDAMPLLCFSNGVLDLETGRFKRCSRDMIATESLPYRYDAEAVCPRWEAFLKEVLPDSRIRAVLQEFLGLCYIDRSLMSVEKFGIFIGSGANGKSVIRDVVTQVMGADNVIGFDAEQLTRSELLPYLIGKRINFASDMKRSASFDSSLKALASGQDVVGRKIYGEPVTVKCPPIIFSMNELPSFHDTSPAFYRRLLLFEFEVTIPPERRDASLAQGIIDEELAGVFNWIMEGRRRLLEQGGSFTRCAPMEDALSILEGSGGSAAFPILEYIRGRGYDPRPRYPGQTYDFISLQEMVLHFGGRLSRATISREMRTLGATIYKGKREITYKVYPRRKEENEREPRKK